MNLYDLVKRKDRQLAVHGPVEAIEPKRPGGGVRAVRLPPGGGLRLNGAEQALALRDFPADLGWRASSSAPFRLTVELEAARARAVLATVSSRGELVPVPLQWPLPSPLRFDLVLHAEATQPVVLDIGPLWSPRTALLPLLRGSGVEVGPGLNPAVRPQPGLTVRYVEKKHPRDWAATYAKRELTAAETALWGHYVVDSARHLAGFAAGSLDFVFSSHVLEHLVDPIGTLARWYERLAPGGVLAGVVPDARFTFDWRQPPFTLDDARAQLGLAADEPTQAMYERWCRYTQPENTPESLRARDYSIHVSYFTPTTLRQVLDAAIAALPAGQPEPDGLALQATTNGKDFSFLLRKPGGAAR